MSKSYTSERTCAGCREKAPRDVLLRLVWDPATDQVATDVRRRLPGRGVSVHPSQRCLDHALQRGGLARGLRRPVQAPVAQLREQARAQYVRRASALLNAALRKGALAVGAREVRQALQSRPVHLLVAAADAAERTQQLVRASQMGQDHQDQQDERSVPCRFFPSKDALGAALGREEVGVVAVLDFGFSSQIDPALAAAASLSEVA